MTMKEWVNERGGTLGSKNRPSINCRQHVLKKGTKNNNGHHRPRIIGLNNNCFMPAVNIYIKKSAHLLHEQRSLKNTHHLISICLKEKRDVTEHRDIANDAEDDDDDFFFFFFFFFFRALGLEKNECQGEQGLETISTASAKSRGREEIE